MPGFLINQQFSQQNLLLYIFIFTVSIVWISLVIHTYKKHDIKTTIIYFLPMILAAIFVESSGVASGRYEYPGYFFYLSIVGEGANQGYVPLVIVLAWSANLVLLLNLAKHVVLPLYQKKNRIQIFLISLFAGIFAICLDLVEDPLAHYNQWWIWDQSLGELTFYNVPIINFLGWFVLIFYMSLATLLIERSHFSLNRKVLLCITSISITGVAIFITHGLISNMV